MRQWASAVPPDAERLIDRFWPGPLTLILPRRPGVGDAAAGGHDSIGLRCPAHPVAQTLLMAYALRREDDAHRERHGPIGIAAPSANRFGRVSPTTAAHVHDEFDGFDVDLLVLDGGACPVGIESTIVGLHAPRDRSDRCCCAPAPMTAAMIEETLGREFRAADRCRAPRVRHAGVALRADDAGDAGRCGPARRGRRRRRGLDLVERPARAAVASRAARCDRVRAGAVRDAARARRRGARARSGSSGHRRLRPGRGSTIACDGRRTTRRADDAGRQVRIIVLASITPPERPPCH